MTTDRIAEFRDADDARAFAKLCGPEYTVCSGVGLKWAVRQATHEERAILGRAIATDQFEPTDYKPSPMSYDDEPGNE